MVSWGLSKLAFLGRPVRGLGPQNRPVSRASRWARGPDLIRSGLVPLSLSGDPAELALRLKEHCPGFLGFMMILLLLLTGFSLVWTGMNQDWAGSQMMQLLPFLERRDGWGVS